MESVLNTSGLVRKTQATYHHGELRTALTEALRVLIERDGPDSFRIAEACRMAGVTTAAPYKHFKDRDAMLRAVALGGMERLRVALQNAADAKPPGCSERIIGIGRAYVHFARSEPGVFRLMFGLTEHNGEDLEMKAVEDACEALVAGVVADHLGCAPGDEDVRLRTHALWCFVHGLSFLGIDGKAERQDPETETALLSLVGQAILPSQ